MPTWEKAETAPRGARSMVAAMVLAVTALVVWAASGPEAPTGDSADTLRVEADDDREDAPGESGGDRVGASGDPAGERDARDAAVSIPLRLLVTDDHALTTVDLSSGHSQRVALDEVSGGDPPFRLTRRGEAVVFFGRGGTTYAVHPAAPDQPWRVGTSAYYLPSAHPDRVWLIDRQEPRGPDFRAREVAVDGVATTDWVDVPAGTSPRAAVSSGLVLAEDGSLRVWDPASGEDVAVLDGPFLAATADDRVAWCDHPCRVLRVTDVVSGDESQVTVPLGEGVWRTHQASFSHAGDLLAVRFGSTSHDAEADAADAAEDAGVAILRVDAGVSLEDVVITSSEPSGPPAWSPSDHYLLLPRPRDGALVYEQASGTSARSADVPFHYDLVADYGIADGSGRDGGLE